MLARVIPLLVTASVLTAASSPHSVFGQQTAGLSAEEVAAGFRPLFDGISTNGWRSFESESFPETGWVVDGGELRLSQGGGDIMTSEQFADFELRLEWKISAGGNSGIFYRVSGEGDAVYVTGPEMQVLDDALHPNGQSRLTSAGSNFGLHAAPAGIVHSAGEWNTVRIIVDGADVEHWLNGTKVVEYELWTDEWEALVAATKFADWPGYGRATRGYIALQDHGDVVAFRSIRIKELP
jgi:hypothetical protein